jgi:hypothetical protein
MPEPKGNDVQRTLAVRVSPDYHSQLSVVTPIDEITLTDLMMRALDNYMAERRAAPDFHAKAHGTCECCEFSFIYEGLETPRWCDRCAVTSTRIWPCAAPHAWCRNLDRAPEQLFGGNRSTCLYRNTSIQIAFGAGTNLGQLLAAPTH